MNSHIFRGFACNQHKHSWDDKIAGKFVANGQCHCEPIGTAAEGGFVRFAAPKIGRQKEEGGALAAV